MYSYPTDSIKEFLLPCATDAACAEPSEIECEVMNLFDEFRLPLLRYAHSFGICVNDAEEITQEVFLALFRHLQMQRPRQNLRGWLFRVAHNLALKQRQAYSRSQEAPGSDWTVVERQLDPSPDPEEQIIMKQRRKRLVAALDALPEQDQCCLRLRAEGLRYREIAAVLSISLAGVSMSLARSLERLMRADRFASG
jgi:RNA polymerase sigma-70 factor (ECF subfamily)